MQNLASRTNLSDDIAAAVRERIVEGRLAAGSHVNEVRMAAELGVSRTPLREALARLAAEGALVVKPRLGFHVTPLTEAEVRQIYPMRALLDPEALRLSGLPGPERMTHLEVLNARIAAAKKPRDVVLRDNDWHLALVEPCPNKVLVETIVQFMQRTCRYELVLLGDDGAMVAAGHAKILAAIKAGDLGRACAALKKNMEAGVEDLVCRLRRKDGNA